MKQTQGHKLPPLTALRTFESVGRHLSSKKATEELCVTASAVSRQIRLLEEYLGVPLLIRNNRKTELTDQGREYLLTLNRAFSEIDEATRTLFPSQDWAQSNRETLKLGVGAAFAEYWLASRIGGFRDLHPDLDLEIHVNQAVSGQEAPLPQVDLEIYTGAEEFAGFEQERLFQLVDYPVCSPRLLGHKLSPVSLDTLLDLTLLHEGSNHWWPRWLKSVSGAVPANASVGPILHDETLSIKLAVAGEGVALGDAISTTEYLRSGELIRPVAESMLTNDWVCLLVRSDSLQGRGAQLFRRWLRAEMEVFNRPS